jgi:REP element-mobilizing transposase RayT
MARKARLEIEGGLYHVITRGNDRHDIFHCDDDFAKFLTLLAVQKEKTAFFLYAFCLMTNHIHLLIERRQETVGRIMQRVLTGYSQWYNRKYRHVGHVFQGRHKSILCDSDLYLAELVRYIHLNPVRAKMVAVPEEYPYSSHREYLGLTPPTVADVDPVLRRFGHTREIAIEEYRRHVLAGVHLAYPSDLDSPAEPRLPEKEFVDDTLHRMGEVDTRERRMKKGRAAAFEMGSLLTALETVLGLSRQQFCGPSKAPRAVMAKEIVILVASDAGIPITQIAATVGIDQSAVSRRHDNARLALASNSKLRFAKEMVQKMLRANPHA